VTKGWGKIKPLKMGKFIPVLTAKPLTGNLSLKPVMMSLRILVFLFQ